jgi:hypothetical protein
MKPRARVEVLLSLFNGQQSVTLPKDKIESAASDVSPLGRLFVRLKRL